MTEEQLAAIEAQADAATPAPWVPVIGGSLQYPSHEIWSEKSRALSGDKGVIGPWCNYDCDHSIAARAEDVLFMASARSNVPALVAEARRLRALMKRVEWSRQEDPHWTSCPWGCIVKTNWEAEEDANGQPTGAHGYRHEPECPAFTEDGEVK